MILPGELRTKKSCPHARKKAGKYYVEKGKCEGCTYWEAWECVPERTVQEIITKDCKKCSLVRKISMLHSNQEINTEGMLQTARMDR